MDSIIEPIGAFGLYQKVSLFIVGCVTCLSAMYYSLILLNYFEPPIRCTYSFSAEKNMSAQTLIASCDTWLNYSQSKTKPASVVCEIDVNFYGATVITEWNLICKRQWLASLGQSIFLIGSLCAFISEIVCSRFGRRKGSQIFIGLLIVSSVTTNLLGSDLDLFSIKFLDTFIIYCIAQFFNGIFVYCMANSTYLLLIDITTARYQQFVSNVNMLFFLLGEVACLVLVYAAKSWRVTSWVLIVLNCCCFFAFTFFMTESPRWLIEISRYDEAYEVLKRIARINKRKSYDSAKNKESAIRLMRMKQSELEAEMANSEFLIEDSFDDEFTMHNKQKQNKILLKKFCLPVSNILKLTMLILFFNFLSLVFFGVSLSMVHIVPINSYVMFLLSSLFGMIGSAVCFINPRVGYRKALLIYLIVFLLCSNLVAFLPDNFDGQNLSFLILFKGLTALFSKCMASAAYSTAIVYIGELLDLKIRFKAMLVLNCVGCFAALATPLINFLRLIVWKSLPYTIYSSASLVCILTVYFLPEFKRRNFSNNQI